MILGIDRLTSYSTILDSFSKIITLVTMNMPRLEKKNHGLCPKWVIPFLRYGCVIEKGLFFLNGLYS